MRTVRTKIYKFSELSKAAQQKAIDAHEDINTFYDWWDLMYDDALTVGIEIKGFDCSYREEIEIDFTYDAEDTAKRILEEHGDTCDTYKTAAAFLQAVHVNQVAMALIGNEDDDFWMAKADDNEDLRDEFKKDIGKDYLKLLREEFEYRQTSEAIIETLEANDHEFTKEGEPYHRKRNIAA